MQIVVTQHKQHSSLYFIFFCVSKNCFFCRPHRYANGALATDVTSWDSTLALSLTARIFLLFFLLVDLGALHIWSLQLVRLKTFLVLRHSPLNPLSAGHISPQPNHPPFQHLEICISIVSKNSVKNSNVADLICIFYKVKPQRRVIYFLVTCRPD